MSHDVTAGRPRLLSARPCGSGRAMVRLAQEDRLLHFSVDFDRMPTAAKFVIGVIRRNYRPRHSFPRALAAFLRRRPRPQGSAVLKRRGRAAPPARAAFDLAIVSVLLDAGAGSAWCYRERRRRKSTTARKGSGWRASAWWPAACSRPGRLSRCGPTRRCSPPSRRSGLPPASRPARPIRWWASRAAPRCSTARAPPWRPTRTSSPGSTIRAPVASTTCWPPVPRAAGCRPTPSSTLLVHLGPIWPGRTTLGGVRLGDTWHHPLIAAGRHGAWCRSS